MQMKFSAMSSKIITTCANILRIRICTRAYLTFSYVSSSITVSEMRMFPRSKKSYSQNKSLCLNTFQNGINESSKNNNDTMKDSKFSSVQLSLVLNVASKFLSKFYNIMSEFYQLNFQTLIVYIMILFSIRIVVLLSKSF